ncbi:MAG: CCA tRNA nucleotidyltransferase [Cyanobacteria bacterium]|nr:CCA tRNA nucleotidyltransferase [Cyanobacteriota bacterium]
MISPIPNLPIPHAVAQALTQAAAGKGRSQRLALVGGAVRDLLLHRVHRDPWRGLLDLDLVVSDRPPQLGQTPEDPSPRPGAQGPTPPAAHRLALALQAQDPAALGYCHFHHAYGTVELELHGVLLDLATARCETYPEPGENPVVGPGVLEDDLARRDFSVNAMALVLEGSSGQLLDPHGGLADLESRRLRFLHGCSVADDPTRLLRGARYGARLGFSLDPASLDQVSSTLASWPWRWRHGDPPELAPPALATRLRMELELLLEREPWRQALALLQGWGALLLLDPALQADRHWRRRLAWAQRLGLPPLVALVAGASQPLALAERLQLPHRQHRLLAQLAELGQRLEAAGPTDGWSVSRWCALLEGHGLSAETGALAIASGVGPRRPLLRWWLRWRQLKAPLSADDLIAAGQRPGPELGERLRALRAERLDQERL